MKHPINFSKRNACNAQGFALIATISVMVLLVMIALAMTTLSGLELRASRAGSAEVEAKANARLALMIALGELQKHTGPDQRVTAEADILSSDGFAGWSAHPEKKHYVGVYSSEEWNGRDGDGVRRNMKTYDENRNQDAFRRWLTSGDSAGVSTLEFAQSSNDADAVTIVGSGTVGEQNAEDQVRVPKDKIRNPDGQLTGHMAWWVGDQNVKAKMNLVDTRKGVASDWDGRFNRANPEHVGVDSIEGLSHVDVSKMDAEELERTISYRQLALVDGKKIEDDVVKARYHDMTTYGSGVLADVALGGLRRDLSLPFELPNLSPPSGASDWDYDLNQTDLAKNRDSDFTSIWEFSNSGDHNAGWISIYWPSSYRPSWWANKMGYCFMYPDPKQGKDNLGFDRYLRGPTWQSLRNHYRSYKREYENLPSNDVARRGWAGPSDDRTWLAQPYQPYSHWHNSRGMHLLSTTYVGARGGADTLLSPDVMDPFYRFGNHTGRPWNNLGHDTLGRSPVFTKVALVLSHRSEPYGGRRRLDLIMNAVGTIWNPYNVPIEFEAVFTNLDLKGLKWNFTREKSGGATEELAIDPEQRSFGREKYFPFQSFRLGVTAETDQNYPFTSQRPSKLIRLNPGESRTFALNFDKPIGYRWSDMTSAPGAFANNWEGGMYLRFSKQWLIDSGDKYTFQLLPQKDESISFESYLGYFQKTKGGYTNPFDANQQGTGFLDLPELASLHVASAADILPGANMIEKTMSNFTDDQEAICYIEFSLRASDDSPHGVVAEFDPRAVVNHSYSMGNSRKGSVPGNWDVKLELVSDFDLMQAGVGDRNNGFWGSSHEGDGETHVVAFEVPDAPITNIAHLQHCQTGANGWDVSYAIGSSLPHPLVPRNSLVDTEATDSQYSTTYYDMSYLANTGLWDRYYFSGLHLNGSSASDPLAAVEGEMEQFLDASEANPLANKRLTLASSSGGLAQDDLIRELTHYRWIARHLMVDGPVNINSTRVEAWKAWLSSLKDEPVDKVNQNGSVSSSTGSGVPFSRSAVAGGDADEMWRGYVRLSATEIEKLVENIVREVRKRGPFPSVADFVNRRLASNDTGEMGALQAALGNSGLDTGRGSEKGIPGTIRQGDILTSLGGVISARSDTFVVRAYGESVSRTDSNRVLARA